MIGIGIVCIFAAVGTGTAVIAFALKRGRGGARGGGEYLRTWFNDDADGCPLMVVGDGDGWLDV